MQSISRTALIFSLACVLVPCLLVLSGCTERQELLSGTDGYQSIEILVALLRSGVDAHREKLTSGTSERYRITVSEKDYPRALELLKESGLAEKTRDVDSEIDSLIQQKGFTPNSQDLANIRLDQALGLRLERLLVALPGVVQAKVLVRAYLQQVVRAGDPPAKPAASIVLRYTSQTGNLPFAATEIRDLAVQSVPGLDPADVKVTTLRVVLPGSSSLFASLQDESKSGPSFVPLHKLFLFRVPEEDRKIALLQIMFYLVAFCAAGLGAGVFWGAHRTRQQIKKRVRRSTGDVTRSLFLEATYSPEDPRSQGKLPGGRSQSKGK